MRPDLTSMNKVRDRIEAIIRRCGSRYDSPPSIKTPPIKTPQNRFVELLDTEEKLKKPLEKKSVLQGRTEAQASVDDLRGHVSRFAEDYNIDEELVRAVIQVESGWKRDAVSTKGAMGLMQLMPRTAAMLEVEDAFDPEQNIEGGVKYLARLTDKYQGDVEMALAAYNAGPGRVDEAGGIPFPETERYVKKVMALYHRYREEE